MLPLSPIDNPYDLKITLYVQKQNLSAYGYHICSVCRVENFLFFFPLSFLWLSYLYQAWEFTILIPSGFL